MFEFSITNIFKLIIANNPVHYIKYSQYFGYSKGDIQCFIGFIKTLVLYTVLEQKLFKTTTNNGRKKLVTIF